MIETLVRKMTVLVEIVLLDPDLRSKAEDRAGSRRRTTMKNMMMEDSLVSYVWSSLSASSETAEGSVW